MDEAQAAKTLTLTTGYGLKNDEQQEAFHNYVDENLTLLKLIDFELKGQNIGVDDPYLDVTGASTFPTASGPLSGVDSTTLADSGAPFHCRDASTSHMFTKAQREGNIVAKGNVFGQKYLQGDVPEGEFERWVYAEVLSRIVANNNEDVLINGVYSATPTITTRGEMLRIQDGLQQKTLTAGNLLDARHLTVSIALILDLYDQIGASWKGDKVNMRYLMADSVESQLRKHVLARETAYADAVLTENGVLRIRGIDVLTVPLWPTNLTSTAGTTSYTNESMIILTHLKNLKWMMANQGSMPYITRWYENPATMALYAYLHRNIDIIVKNDKALAKAYQVATSGTAYTTA